MVCAIAILLVPKSDWQETCYDQGPRKVRQPWKATCNPTSLTKGGATSTPTTVKREAPSLLLGASIGHHAETER